MLLRRLQRKGCRLDPIPLNVLLCLKAAERRLSIEQITAALNANDSPADLWTPETVEAELRRLSAVALGDGSVVPLVSRDADGTWAPVGV